MKKTIIVIAVFIAIVSIVSVSAEHDLKAAIAVDAYDACVRSEYYMTPGQFYAENGSYPVCE